jgi:hypothetical protein
MIINDQKMDTSTTAKNDAEIDAENDDKDSKRLVPGRTIS